uniref:C-type lectin domain-containing protein n=1 Tax=Panagrolaimus superbus TaxID=310955 RepID=A0A914Z5M7_9BILA
MLVFTFLLLFLFQANASCPSGNVVEWNSNCYIFQTNVTEFASAEISCKLMAGNLVSVHDAFTNALLAGEAINYFQQSTENDFWIGGTLLMHAGNWSWIDNSIFDFIDWNKGEPQNISGNGCISVSTVNGAWSSQDCFKAKPYICNVASTTPPPTNPSYLNCSLGWTYFQPTGSCYGVEMPNPGKLNWTAAEEYCEKSGAHLTSIHSWEEYSFIETFDAFAWNGHFWIGMFSNDGGKTWMYTDGTPYDYEHRDDEHCKMPNPRCAACGQFGICTFECTEDRLFLCKKKAHF